MFTTQHYTQIAAVIAEIEDQDTRELIAHTFSYMLKQDNENFDIVLFFDACNLDFWGRTPAEIAIESMPYSKFPFATKAWKYLQTGKNYPDVPEGMSIVTASDIWIELSLYDTKTGKRIENV